MYTSKLKIKTSSVNAWRSLCWWPDLSDCLITSSISQGRPQKNPADHNCWDDGEARREDLGWQNISCITFPHVTLQLFRRYVHVNTVNIYNKENKDTAVDIGLTSHAVLRSKNSFIALPTIFTQNYLLHRHKALSSLYMCRCALTQVSLTFHDCFHSVTRNSRFLGFLTVMADYWSQSPVFSVSSHRPALGTTCVASILHWGGGGRGDRSCEGDYVSQKSWRPFYVVALKTWALPAARYI